MYVCIYLSTHAKARSGVPTLTAIYLLLAADFVCTCRIVYYFLVQVIVLESLRMHTI